MSGERRFRQPPRREFGPDGDVCQHGGWGGNGPERLKEKPAGADGRGTEQWGVGGGGRRSV